MKNLWDSEIESTLDLDNIMKDVIINDNKSLFIRLRIPSKMLKRVNEELTKRVGISRTGWILEAIDEKINPKV